MKTLSNKYPCASCPHMKEYHEEGYSGQYCLGCVKLWDDSKESNRKSFLYESCYHMYVPDNLKYITRIYEGK